MVTRPLRQSPIYDYAKENCKVHMEKYEVCIGKVEILTVSDMHKVDLKVDSLLLRDDKKQPPVVFVLDLYMYIYELLS
jgi:hypothetical protein